MQTWQISIADIEISSVSLMEAFVCLHLLLIYSYLKFEK